MLAHVGDELVLLRDQRGEIRRTDVGREACEQMRRRAVVRLRAREQRLRWHTADVDARTADRCAFDHDDARTETGSVDRGGERATAGTDDCQVVIDGHRQDLLDPLRADALTGSKVFAVLGGHRPSRVDQAPYPRLANPVSDLAALAFGVDELAPAQTRQMIRHSTLRHAERVNQFRHRARTTKQQLENRQTSRVAQHPKEPRRRAIQRRRDVKDLTHATHYTTGYPVVPADAASRQPYAGRERGIDCRVARGGASGSAGRAEPTPKKAGLP